MKRRRSGFALVIVATVLFAITPLEGIGSGGYPQAQAGQGAVLMSESDDFGGGQGRIATGPGLGAESVLLTYNNQKPVVTYTGSLGVTIKSFASDWADQASLKAVYQELLANYHGKELEYLQEVDLYPDYPYGNGVAGQYFGRYQWDFAGNRYYDSDGRIEIYGVNDRNQLSDIARTLSHEYGHHFTMYHLWMKEGTTFGDWSKTGYAKLRNLVGLAKVSIYGEHQWSPAELAAEDYVQLFGSALARRSVQFDDQFGTFDSNMFNLAPQENLELPLAAQVTGLESYWLKLAGNQSKGLNAPAGSPTLALVGTDQVGGHTAYEFAWSKAIDPESDNVEYTLVYYQQGDTLAAPVKVVMNQYKATFTNYGRLDGKLLFRVFAKDQGNKIISSNVLEIDLANPRISTTPAHPLYLDLGPDHWAYAVIGDLKAKNLISGYQDKTFRPANPVTRGEWVVMLVRSLELTGVGQGNEFTDTGAYWGKAQIQTAWEHGLIGGYADGSFRPNSYITRGEVAAILARALALPLDGSPAVKYQDVAGHWAAQAISQAAEEKIITGYPDGTFRPQQKLNRAEAASLISRAASL